MSNLPIVSFLASLGTTIVVKVVVVLDAGHLRKISEAISHIQHLLLRGQ